MRRAALLLLPLLIAGCATGPSLQTRMIGYMGAPEAVAKAVDSIQSHSTSNPCSFAQKGAIAALKGDQQALSDMHDEFDMRRNYMYDRISKIANITVIGESAGGMSVHEPGGTKQRVLNGGSSRCARGLLIGRRCPAPRRVTDGRSGRDSSRCPPATSIRVAYGRIALAHCPVSRPF